MRELVITQHRWVVGPRSANDTVTIGPYESKHDAMKDNPPQWHRFIQMVALRRRVFIVNGRALRA
jgi:hypothetical protein